MYTQNYDCSKEKPKVITYPNQDAIKAMKRAGTITDVQQKSQTKNPTKTEQDENLFLLILTLLLSPDIESSGIEYLVSALTFIT